ncbi:hypothetical protein [Dactylosporangium sp. CA-233914]|uniref:hypothetical protein n=1 Tax=Dactylosporangium sp. CA-233914 TaxID=3239934 RepID=UPI003D94B2C5
MEAGIAQVAAQAGWEATLRDPGDEARSGSVPRVPSRCQRRNRLAAAAQEP